MPSKRKNPVYRVPEITVFLGQVLDLDLEYKETRIRVESFAGWNMLVKESAEQHSPGRGKIYLLPGALDPVADGSEAPAEGTRTYETWTGRGPEVIAELQTPDNIGFYQGLVLRIGYSSDRGAEPDQVEDYDHYFIENGGIAPRLYTDRAELENATSAVIVGGDFLITDRGIE
jgi:hypothetical protein